MGLGSEEVGDIGSVRRCIPEVQVVGEVADCAADQGGQSWIIFRGVQDYALGDGHQDGLGKNIDEGKYSEGGRGIKVVGGTQFDMGVEEYAWGGDEPLD